MFCLGLNVGSEVKDEGTITQDVIQDDYLIWKNIKAGRKYVVP